MSRPKRRVKERRRRHALLTRAGTAGGLAVAATLLSASVAHADTFTVTNTSDSGTGSLRAAITQANAATAGANTITFASGLTGAIDVASDLPTITGAVSIVGPGANELTVDGGGIHQLFDLSRTPTATASSISGLTISGSDDGGIVAIEPLTLSGDDIAGNASYAGGGVYAGTLTVTGSTISGNTVTGYGGGINAGSLEMTGSTVTGNTASGIYGSGGIAVGDGSTIVGSTITGNRATAANGPGGGIRVFQGDVTLEDSVVSGNTAATGPDVSSSSAGSASFSLIGNTSGSMLSTDGTDIIGTDPMLGPLQANGGPTLTMAPLPGSPLLDAGKAFGVTTDQRGFSRTVDLPGVANAAGGDGTDIGAVELQASEAPAPTVSGVSPTSANAGSTVTISGSGFTGATQVLFGSTAATAFTVTNDGQITATVPAGTGTVDIRVIGPYGESSVATSDTRTNARTRTNAHADSENVNPTGDVRQPAATADDPGDRNVRGLTGQRQALLDIDQGIQGDARDICGSVVLHRQRRQAHPPREGQRQDQDRDQVHAESRDPQGVEHRPVDAHQGRAHRQDRRDLPDTGHPRPPH
jgi:hypothetical protein